MKNMLSCRKKFFLFGIIVFTTLFIIGCADFWDDSDDSDPFANQGDNEYTHVYPDDDTTPHKGGKFTVGQPILPNYNPVNVFPQFIPSDDPDGGGGKYDGAAAPGMANVWDIVSDFELADGGDDQFDGALVLTVGSTDFPTNQTYGELTFYTPVMGAADGIMTAAVSNDTTTWYPPITSYSAYLYPTGNSILQQTVNLGSATGSITLHYSLRGASWGGSDDWSIYFPGAPNRFRIVIRSIDGTELATIYSLTDHKISGTYNGTADISAYSGQTIVLSFEHNGQNDPIVIDKVSITDGAAAEFVANGNFETGTLSSWTANTAENFIQNITSGTRTLEGLNVTRSFYTVPNKLWGRWVDVFSNPTGSDIKKTITYYTDLGSDNRGIIYFSPNTNNKAITSWDGSKDDRDIGYVFGNVKNVTFTSATALNSGTGRDDVYAYYDITVPAHSSVVIVNFLIMSGTDTGWTATDITARATEIDTVAAAIVNNFWTDPQYRDGMTQAQADAIINF